MGKAYDVAIVGTGPAGMFAALELVKAKPGVKIVMLDKGPVRDMGDKENCTSGWGGAGAFSDGKLDLSHVVGGTIHEVIGRDAFYEILPYIDQTYLYFGGSNKRFFDAKSDEKLWEKVIDLKNRAMRANLDLRPFPIRHLGTDTAHTIVMNIKRFLEVRGVEIRTNCSVETIKPQKRGFKLVLGEENGSEFVRAEFVLASPGRSGAEWLAGEAKRLGLKLENNGVDIGVRVEVRNETLAEIAKLLYEAKLYYFSKRSDDQLRTFCMCPSGFVAKENYRGLVTVNGHSYSEKSSPNTNFAILTTQVFTHPFDDPLGYGKDISELANKLAGGGLLVQRLGDLRAGRRSKLSKLPKWVVQPTLMPPDAIPGDLSLAIPHRHLENIIEMLDALEHIAPGIASRHTLLYGIEVKFYSFKIETSEGFETAIPKLYVAGDGSGYTRGLIQSSMQGTLVARHISARLTGNYSAPTLSSEESRHEDDLRKRLDMILAEAGSK